MSYLDEATIAAIDQRIARSQQTTTAVGTVAQRDTTGPGALVVFDGTSIAQPVKVLGHVHVDQDDRVVLQLFGSSWVVMGSFSRREIAGAYRRDFCPSASTASTSFVDVPSGTVITGFLKRYDGTDLRLTMSMTTWSDVVDTNMAVGIRVSGTAGTDTANTYTANDIIMNRQEYDVVGVRITAYASLRLGATPAGSYDFTARWRRVSGTGSLIVNASDQVILDVLESAPVGGF